MSFIKHSSILLLLILCPAFGLNLDGALLLSFKYSILSDPLSLLHDWDYSDATPCLWKGVKCAQLGSTVDTWRVVTLALPNSHLVGIISEYIGFIPHLRTLDLSNNFFNGTLPVSLFNAAEIEFVSLANNAVSGAVPGGVRSIEFLDLSSNLLNGSLPLEFGGNRLTYLNFSSNKLSGIVPPQFAAKIPPNATIDLSFNDLSGELPESVALSNQKPASYAGNEALCGKPLNKPCVASRPNISTNSSSPAIASIPNTIGTTPLPDSPQTTPSGAIPPQRGLKPSVIAEISVIPVAGIAVLATAIIYMYQKKKKKTEFADKETTVSNAYGFKKDPEPSMTRPLPPWACLSIQNGDETSDSTESESDDSVADHHQYQPQLENYNERSLVMFDGETEVEIDTLLMASAYVLGSSSATAVYKAVLHNGAAFAVRRIGESGVEKAKELLNRVKAIAKVRHENLVRVRGLYCGEGEKLVIYDYVSNENLANVGYRKIRLPSYHLPFEARLRIAQGVARGLAYIHEKKHVHGNIKPSNILLTQDMKPMISDFGLHWLIHGNHTRKSNSLMSPYNAPESLNSVKPNTKWDVYSFGILLLELLTGEVFSEQELSRWTATSIVEDPGRVVEMADVAIRGDAAGQQDSTVAWFKLGFSCACLVPVKRPSMKEALHVLEKILK